MRDISTDTYRLFGIDGRHHREAARFERTSEAFYQEWLVVDEQDGAPTSRWRAFRASTAIRSQDGQNGQQRMCHPAAGFKQRVAKPKLGLLTKAESPFSTTRWPETAGPCHA